MSAALSHVPHYWIGGWGVSPLFIRIIHSCCGGAAAAAPQQVGCRSDCILEPFFVELSCSSCLCVSSLSRCSGVRPQTVGRRAKDSMSANLCLVFLVPLSGPVMKRMSPLLVVVQKLSVLQLCSPTSRHQTRTRKELMGFPRPSNLTCNRWAAAVWPFIGVLFAASSPVSVIESFDAVELLFFSPAKKQRAWMWREWW